MIPDEIRAQALKSREVTVDVEGRSFMLRIPTLHEVTLGQRSAARLASSLGESAVDHVVQRLITETAIVGWEGIKLADVLGEGEEVVPFDRALVDVLLDAQPRWGVLLAAEIYERLVARNAATTADAKN